jgi:hypothetical protein
MPISSTWRGGWVNRRMYLCGSTNQQVGLRSRETNTYRATVSPLPYYLDCVAGERRRAWSATIRKKSESTYQFKVKNKRFMLVPYEVKAGSAKKDNSGRDMAAPILSRTYIKEHVESLVGTVQICAAIVRFGDLVFILLQRELQNDALRSPGHGCFFACAISYAGQPMKIVR